MLLVVTPIKGSPAYKAGIKAGDIITTDHPRGGQRGQAAGQARSLPTKGLALHDAVKKILGKPGTKVKLTVERKGENKPLEFEITRGLIDVETVLGVKRKADDDWDFIIDPGEQDRLHPSDAALPATRAATWTADRQSSWTSKGDQGPGARPALQSGRPADSAVEDLATCSSTTA